VGLRLDAIRAGWGPRDLLRGLHLRVEPGERVALLGPNGAGKTTLLDVVAGRLRPRAGRVLLGDRDVTRLDPPARARAGVALVPQEPSLFAGLTVRENLRAAIVAPACRRAQPPSALEESLVRWGLLAVADTLVEVLSGGERRRAELARTLLLSPAVLLLDEPLAGLDPQGRAGVARGIEALPLHLPILLTDHAALEAVALATRVMLLVDGVLAADVPRSAFDPDSPLFRPYFGTASMH
jgi:ABC-type lipopolysaccharide export system ATPase subunit